MAGMVVKVKWFFERAAYWKNKKLSIVAVGASPNDNPEVDEFLNNLLTDEQRPLAMNNENKDEKNKDEKNKEKENNSNSENPIEQNNKNSSEDDKKKGEMISKSYDISDKRFIAPVVDYARGKDNE